MAGGKHHHRTRDWLGGSVFKGVILSEDERAKALQLTRHRFNAVAIARALGRRVPEVADFLNSLETSR